MLTLAELNRRFYSGETARQFSETRHRAWPGFRKLLPHIGRTRSHSVLDVGCGNGRLATFLAGELESPLSYHGIDASAELLEDARRATAATCPQASFEIRDLVLDPNERLPQGPYSVIAAIAVLHHIPGAARRRQLVSALGERLAPGGVLVLTAWRFDRIERIASRVVPWAKAIASLDLAIDEGSLEAGDQLIAWGNSGRNLRYCHLFDDARWDALIGASPLHCVARFGADGSGGDHNEYAILRRDLVSGA